MKLKQKSTKILQVLGALALGSVLASNAFAIDGFYNGSESPVDNSGWMSLLPNNLRLANLSIPGTHDSGTHTSNLTWGFGYVTTQGMNFPNQFKAGIRFVDIRVRHIDNGFALHHGAWYLNQNFTDVMNNVNDFLDSHPNEVIFMRLKNECNDNPNAFECRDGVNSNTFIQTFDNYMSTLGRRVWTGTDANPTLGQLRGKVVIFNNLPGTSGYAPISYGDRFKEDVNLQDYYNPSSDDDKWQKIVPALDKTGAGDPNTPYMNYLSGYTLGANTPMGLAKDINPWTYGYLLQHLGQRAGFVVMDFPGVDMIHAIIVANNAVLKSAGNDGYAGNWGAEKMCAPGEYVYGYHQKSEPEQGSGDDTGLNSVALQCGRPGNLSYTATNWIESAAGGWGSWGTYADCGAGNPVTGFNMKIEAPLGNGGDNTGANEVHLYCGASHSHIFSSTATHWGDYTGNLYCPAGQAVVGLSTRVEVNEYGIGDDTSMNGLRLICGDYAPWHKLQRIQNRWHSEQYLNIENGSIQSSNINPGWLSAMWVFEPVDGTDYLRIKNGWHEDQYLNIEAGAISSTAINPGWHSAQWLLEPVQGTNYVRIQNRWHPEQYLHIENGYIQSGSAGSGWLSAQWNIQ